MAFSFPNLVNAIEIVNKTFTPLTDRLPMSQHFFGILKEQQQKTKNLGKREKKKPG